MAKDPYDVQSAAGGDTASDFPNAVGYGHPPQATRFRRGQSGNPSGRPKRRRSFKLDIAAALDAQSRELGDATKQREFAENLVNDALARKPLAMKILVPIMLAVDDDDSNGENGVTPLDEKLIADFGRRDESKSKDGSDK
jgi:hypothetical protein